MKVVINTLFYRLNCFVLYSVVSLFCGSTGSHFSVAPPMMEFGRLFCCSLNLQLAPLIDRSVINSTNAKAGMVEL